MREKAAMPFTVIVKTVSIAEFCSPAISFSQRVDEALRNSSPPANKWLNIQA